LGEGCTGPSLNIATASSNDNKREEEVSAVEGTVEISTDGGGAVSDSGSTTDRSSRPGPGSSKGHDEVKKPTQEDLTTRAVGTKKRKKVSPLLGAGKSIAPDKRRKKKVWKRPQISDRDSGSEVELASDEDVVLMSENMSDSSVDRSKRAAKREERSIAAELKERELEISKPVSPDLRRLDLKSLQELGCEWLNGIDTARRRSSNLKGELSGQIKNFVDKSKDLMEVLVSRLSDRGDASFLRTQVTELTAQLRVLKCEEEARNREISALKREVEILKNSMQPGGSGTVKPMVRGVDIRSAVPSANSGG